MKIKMLLSCALIFGFVVSLEASMSKDEYEKRRRSQCDELARNMIHYASFGGSAQHLEALAKVYTTMKCYNATDVVHPDSIHGAPHTGQQVVIVRRHNQ